MSEFQCMKTGGWAYLPKRSEYVYGDIYADHIGNIKVTVIASLPDNYQSNLEGVGDIDRVWATLYDVETSIPEPYGQGYLQVFIGRGHMHKMWSHENNYMVPVPTGHPFKEIPNG